MEDDIVSGFSFQIPYDLRTVHSWCRYYARFDPQVSGILNAMSDFVASKLRLKTVAQEISGKLVTPALDRFVLEMAFEYFKLGEGRGLVSVLPDGQRCFKTLNPSELSVRGLGGREIVYLSDSVLDDASFISVVRKWSRYDLRGTPLLVPIMRNLELLDKLSVSDSGFDTEALHKEVGLYLLGGKDIWRVLMMRFSGFRDALASALTEKVFNPALVASGEAIVMRDVVWDRSIDFSQSHPRKAFVELLANNLRKSTEEVLSYYGIPA